MARFPPLPPGRKLVSGTIKEATLSSRAARARLKSGRQPHWRNVVPGKVHLGYQRWKGDREGRWVLRRLVGPDKYSVMGLGRADDAAAANGDTVLSFEQAEAKARSLVEARVGKIERLTVRQAMERYIDNKRSTGQSVSDVLSRGSAHILPPLGDLVVSELTPEVLRRWLATMANAPAQTRPKAGKPKYRPAPEGDEAVRARRASANRVLGMLKAMLNHAYDEGHVATRDAWGRKLKPFRDVEVARVRYLTVAEAARLINAADLDFRPLVRAALETGCRYSELGRLEVADFNGDSNTIHIRKSKTGKGRHIVLTPEGAFFFSQHCAGRAGHELMFRRDDGSPWQKSNQKRRIAAAVRNAKISPAISFHGLRHTWASLAVMNGVPLLVIARNLGHVDTTMVEKHYGHLAPSFITEAIHAGAPRYGVKEEPRKVLPLR
jgi:integrase